MTDSIDIGKLTARLQSRVGVALSFSMEDIDGGEFPTLRPVDLEPGYGFRVAIARTPRQVMASFHLDRYARRLLYGMAEADLAARLSMNAMVQQARSVSLQTSVLINGEEMESAFASSEPWQSLEIEVGSRIPTDKDRGKLEDVALLVSSHCLAIALSLMQVEDISGSSESIERLPEGALTRIEVNKYERSPANRAACLAHFGCRCQICSFDFGVVYGPIGEGFIEVHHIVPVSEMGGSYFVDPVRDLIPLCPNCHAIIHRSSPPMQIGDLRELLASHPVSRNLVV